MAPITRATARVAAGVMEMAVREEAVTPAYCRCSWLACWERTSLKEGGDRFILFFFFLFRRTKLRKNGTDKREGDWRSEREGR